jgi:glutamyl-tRNA reductase
MYEHGWAMQQIAEGKDVDKILEEMSRRITEKLMHPIFIELKKSTVADDTEASKQRYKEKYLNKNLPKADHVDGQEFDKD